MTVYFLDSSALVKRYTTETGTDWIRQITRPSLGRQIVIAQIASVEMVSALARKQRESNISSRTFQAALLLIDRHVKREYIVIRFTDQVEQRAKKLLTIHPLRAYDAIQLASALLGNQQLVSAKLDPLIFSCGDQRLNTIAAQEGLQTDDPNTHS